MSSSLAKSAGILMFLALSISPGIAQTDKLEQQVKDDKSTLSAQRQRLADYQKQAAWYEQFAKQRLANAAAERAEVEKRLKSLTEAQGQNPNKNPKSPIAQEIVALQGWLNDEAAKRRQIENTREKWRVAIQNELSKIADTKYEKDADAASLQHQKDIDKANATIQAENPKPAPPQIQQNTILMPGWEQDTGNIPVIEQGMSGEQGGKGQ